MSSIIVAPLGDAPSIEKAIAHIRHEPGSEPVIEHFERRLGAEDAHRRYFIVAFADGSMRAVYPSDDDPLRFEQQVVGGRGRDLLRLEPDGTIVDVFEGLRPGALDLPLGR